MRPNGTILFDDSLTTHPVVQEAKRRQEQRQRQNQERAERRANQPLLNRDRYPEKYAQWLKWYPTGHGKQPKCWMCREATIFWNEPAHVCEGFKPQFVDAEVVEERYEARRVERRERWEAQREAIREAKANGTFFPEEDGEYDEGDYCEGDDDGYECEDDDDPLWD
jgi:hypothetical protein